MPCLPGLRSVIPPMRVRGSLAFLQTPTFAGLCSLCQGSCGGSLKEFSYSTWARPCPQGTLDFCWCF